MDGFSHPRLTELPEKQYNRTAKEMRQDLEQPG